MDRFTQIPPILRPGEGLAGWQGRRAGLLTAIEQTEYGCRPDLACQVGWQTRQEDAVLSGTAVRRLIDLTVTTSLGSHTIPLVLFFPRQDAPAPATLLICSRSREAKPMSLPVGIDLNAIPQMMAKLGVVMDGPMRMDGPSRPLNLAEDLETGHWPVKTLLARGHAAAAFYATDAEPDCGDFTGGLAEIFGTKPDRGPHEWGVLAVWAFAARCALDCLRACPELDAGRIGVTGHSRCGKAALWAGATDERFAWVMPNGAGCCGSALLREKHGENLAAILTMMPYWFAPALREYLGREGALPFDQHTLLALIAPRLLHVGSGSEDFWADPPSEYKATALAGTVYQLYGAPALEATMPAPGTAVTAGTLGYHLRRGPHLLEEFDWLCLLNHLAQAGLV